MDQLAAMAKAGQSLLDCLAQCSVESGVCCCGDDMAKHSNPMNCGHSPVDSGAYYTELAADKLRALIAGALDRQEARLAEGRGA